MNIDFKKLIQQATNEKMKQNKELKPVVELLNRYGIYGSDVPAFLLEFSQLRKGNENGTEHIAD